jgi:aminopeptidase N
VTCRDWFQLTLKEGLTVFRDQGFSADMNSAPVKRIEVRACVCARARCWTRRRLCGCRTGMHAVEAQHAPAAAAAPPFVSTTAARPRTHPQDVAVLRASQFSEDAGPMAHPIR